MTREDDIDLGCRIPSFTSVDQDGDEFSSDEMKGTAFVLYFYPKDGTSGCTTEACAFRDELDNFEQIGVTVIGVSPDSHDSHRQFMEKHDLNFTLLADEDRELCTLFDVIKSGKLERTTFLIDANGIIQWIERPVQVEGHVERVKQAILETGV